MRQLSFLFLQSLRSVVERKNKQICQKKEEKNSKKLHGEKCSDNSQMGGCFGGSSKFALRKWHLS